MATVFDPVSSAIGTAMLLVAVLLGIRIERWHSRSLTDSGAAKPPFERETRELEQALQALDGKVEALRESTAEHASELQGMRESVAGMAADLGTLSRALASDRDPVSHECEGDAEVAVAGSASDTLGLAEAQARINATVGESDPAWLREPTDRIGTLCIPPLLALWRAARNGDLRQAFTAQGAECREWEHFVVVRGESVGADGTLVFPLHDADTGSMIFKSLFDAPGKIYRFDLAAPARLSARAWKIPDIWGQLTYLEPQKGRVERC